MIYKHKHNKFIANSYSVAKSLKEKLSFLDNKYHISQKVSIVKDDVVGVSQLMYEDLNQITQAIKKQYQKTPLPGYISYGLTAISEIKSDIHLNPLNKETEEQVKKIDKSKFLAIGVACFMLSATTLEVHSFYNKDTQKINITPIELNLNLSAPKSNPTNQLAQSLQPKFMTSVFKNKLEAFTKLLGMTEGKANFFYKDNLGVATAYGWNPTKNSKEFNVDVAHKIGMSTAQVKTIKKISDNSTVQSVPAPLKKVVLSEKQVQKSAEVMMTFYENEFLKVMKIKSQENNKDYEKMLKAYHQLPNNQQAVMVHMAYKVGTPNLLKYNKFFKQLFNYMEHPTSNNLDKVTANFDYSYKTRKGTRLHDTRVEEAHNEFFNECSIKDVERKQKEVVKERVSSCRNLVASKTIKIANKG